MTTQKRTLEDLRSEISVRLGFGGAGAATITNSPIIDSFIRSAQEQLYWSFEWRDLVKYEDQSTGIDQVLYDYPEDCEVERILSVSVKDGDTWYPVTEGITMEMRSDDTSARPLRFERFDQIEVWPPADAAYTMRIYYVQSLAPLSANSDRTTVKSELVFLHALTNAKLHYRQPDAQVYGSQLEALLNRLKEKQRTSAPIRRTHETDFWQTQSPPRVVGRD